MQKVSLAKSDVYFLKHVRVEDREALACLLGSNLGWDGEVPRLLYLIWRSKKKIFG